MSGIEGSMQTIRSVLVMAFLAVGACATTATGRSSLASEYGPMNLFGGYSEKLVEPGIWKVTGRSNGPAGDGYGRNVAAYRAAEVIKAAGFTYMQIIDQQGSTRTVGTIGSVGTPAGESLELWVRGSNDATPPADCRAKVAERCSTVEIAQLMHRLAPQLGLPSAGR